MIFNLRLNSEVLLCLVVIGGTLYYVIIQSITLPSSKNLVDGTLKYSSALPLRSCEVPNARENFKRAKKISNESFTLEDIDRATVEEISQCNYTNASLNKSKIIIVVPYRNRKQDLLAFLLHMIPYFRYQGKKIEILIAEQNGTRPFNRAKLFNAAIREIKKSSIEDEDNRLANSTCFAFHDVDKLPENLDVPYSCVEGPYQLMRLRTCDSGSYAAYPNFLGGVTMFSMEQLEKINGASNSFEGWGGEDDDLRKRIHIAGMKIVIPPIEKGQFYEGNFQHPRDRNPDRMKLLSRKNQESIMLVDGLLQVNYTLLARIDFKTFVWLLLAV
ncbi:hypothetical protein Aperf_G00000054269 [Anoplocephala perfoliata]